jgi:addiction module HigA family antidote
MQSMNRRTPPHPGKFITDIYLEPNDLSGRDLAGKLGVTSSTLSRVLNGTSAISPEMALRLSKVVGVSAERWLAMQNEHDLCRARRRFKLGRLKRLVTAPLRRATRTHP